MFELFVYVYSCNALSARFFAVDWALNSYFMIMMIISISIGIGQSSVSSLEQQR